MAKEFDRQALEAALGAALGAARQFQGHFRVFGQGLEAVETVAASVRHLGEVEAARDKAKADVEELETLRDGLRSEVARLEEAIKAGEPVFQRHLKELQEKQKQERKAATSKHADNLQRMQEAANLRRAEIQASVDAAEQEFARQREAHGRELAEMRRAKEDHQREADGLQGQLAELNTAIENLQRMFKRPQ